MCRGTLIRLAAGMAAVSCVVVFYLKVGGNLKLSQEPNQDRVQKSAKRARTRVLDSVSQFSASNLEVTHAGIRIVGDQSAVEQSDTDSELVVPLSDYDRSEKERDARHLMEKKYWDEFIDPEWRREQELLLRDHFQSEEFQNVRVDEIGCRSQSCRLVISSAEGSDQAVDPFAIVTGPAFAGQVNFHQEQVGSNRYVFYVLRVEK